MLVFLGRRSTFLAEKLKSISTNVYVDLTNDIIVSYNATIINKTKLYEYMTIDSCAFEPNYLVSIQAVYDYKKENIMI